MKTTIDVGIKLALQITSGLLFALLWISIPAFATENKYNKGQVNLNVEAEAESKAIASAKSVSESSSKSYATGGSGGDGGEGGAASAEVGAVTASNEGISIDASESNRIENNSSNVVLVPNNNTENCLRVFGVAWGKSGESGALGVPWRSKKCDYEQAADDAFAAGERETGWFWKCQNSNLYKAFKSKGESNESAQNDCHARMVGEANNLRTINTLKEQLTTVNSERETDRKLAREAQERITEACNESKDRILEYCAPTK
jgi:hypothetical protein